jgi:hypothetical protein
MSGQAVAWAIVHQAGGPSAKAVLLSIANYADASGECWQDQPALAAGAECSVRQFRNIMRGLIERGLVEQVRRGSSTGGRRPNLIRLRMRELPVIISAKETTVTGCRKPAIQRNRQRLPETQLPAKIADRVSGNPALGNRQMVAGILEDPTIPTTLSNERVSAARKLLAAMRPHMSATGNQRSKPIPCDKALTPIIKRHGFDAVLAAAMAFYATPQARKDGGEFQPGLQVIANDGRLEALIAPLVDYEPALRIWRSSDQQFWDRAKYGPAPNEPGYRGPPDDLLAAGVST